MVPCQRRGVACASYRHRVVSRRYKVVCQHHDAIGRHRNCRVADALACIPRPAVLPARCLQHSRTQNRTEHIYSTDEQPSYSYRQQLQTVACIHTTFTDSDTATEHGSMVYFPFVLTFFLLFHISPLLTFHHDESPLLSLLTSSCNFFFCETAVSSSRMLASREPSKFARALAPRELRTDQQTEARQEFLGLICLSWKPAQRCGWVQSLLSASRILVRGVGPSHQKSLHNSIQGCSHSGAILASFHGQRAQVT